MIWKDITLEGLDRIQFRCFSKHKRKRVGPIDQLSDSVTSSLIKSPVRLQAKIQCVRASRTQDICLKDVVSSLHRSTSFRVQIEGLIS